MTRLIDGIVGLAFFLAFANPMPAAADNVLRWASLGGALTFDPHSVDEVPTIAQNRQVYERLVGYDSDLKQVPQLAVSWRPIDPLTWEFRLREGVRFHDGTPFSAEGVVFSLERARATNSIRSTSIASSTPRSQTRSSVSRRSSRTRSICSPIRRSMRSTGSELHRDGSSSRRRSCERSSLASIRRSPSCVHRT